jgi:DNA ligase-1
VKHAESLGYTRLCLVEQIPIVSDKQAHKLYNKWLSKGGEGAVIRDPTAPYFQKRTVSLLKWKPELDSEAKVIGYTEGKGRYKGMLGAFQVQMVDGRKHKFSLAGRISAEFRGQYKFKGGKMVSVPAKGYPRIGSIVTYEYMSMTDDGLPRQPVFLRLRK